jgi:hypothetical protein
MMHLAIQMKNASYGRCCSAIETSLTRHPYRPCKKECEERGNVPRHPLPVATVQRFFFHAHLDGVIGDESMQNNYAFSLSYANCYNA